MSKLGLDLHVVVRRLLHELPPIAVSYDSFVDVVERAGWRLTQAAPLGTAGFAVHGEHRRRTEPSGLPQRCSILVSQSDLHPEAGPGADDEWLHASIYLGDDTTPTYADLVMLHRAVFGRRRYAYQCFVPETAHVNIKEVLHLWGRVDGKPCLPDFAVMGSI
jgi:hypothetical protein